MSPKKPTRVEEWNTDAVALLRKHCPREERVQMDGNKLFVFWSEHCNELGRWPGSGDVWQAFHCACMHYIGPNAYF
jgi:hypothetical protein